MERYRNCLEILLLHGIEPHGVNLLNTMRLLLRQLRHIPLTKRNPEMEPVFQRLIDYAQEPVPLTNLCRRVIRIAIGHPVNTKVQQIVGLGPRLRDFILLKDLTSGHFYSS